MTKQLGIAFMSKQFWAKRIQTTYFKYHLFHHKPTTFETFMAPMSRKRQEEPDQGPLSNPSA
jgi:hypothetical protein